MKPIVILFMLFLVSCGNCNNPIRNKTTQNTRDSIEYIIKCDTTQSAIIDTETGSISMGNEIICDTIDTVVYKVQIKNNFN